MMLKPAKRDIDPDAKSHAGRHGDFSVLWRNGGWYVVTHKSIPDHFGPFHTSQAAFGAVKDAIDELLGARCG